MSDSPQDAGFLHAFLLDGRGGGRRLTWSEAQNWQPSDGIYGCTWTIPPPSPGIGCAITASWTT